MSYTHNKGCCVGIDSFRRWCLGHEQLLIVLVLWKKVHNAIPMHVSWACTLPYAKQNFKYSFHVTALLDLLDCLYVTGSAKTGHNHRFSISLGQIFIMIWVRCPYILTNFQFLILTTLGVIALQSSNNRKIQMYSEYRKNKLQVLIE